MTKEFRETTSNTVGTDMSVYRVMQKYQFACDFMSPIRVSKLPVVLKLDDEPNLVSPAYPVFEVKDRNELDPEYLMMWFRRPEFDRYATFKCDAAIRGGYDWEELCETLIPVPNIEKQREIVAEYNTIQNRITLNEQLIQKLEETAQAIYREWFVEGVDVENLPEEWRMGVLSDLCKYSNQRVATNELLLDNYISTENMLQGKSGVKSANSLPNVPNVTSFENGNILISNIRPYFKKIWLANFSGGCSNDVLCLVPNDKVPPLYLYQVVEKDNFFEYVMAGSKGTKMPRGDKKWIMNYEAVIPSNELLEKFSKTSNILQSDAQLKKKENQKLTELKELLLSKLATVEN
jgi:type I restriction enzyme S subunit